MIFKLLTPKSILKPEFLIYEVLLSLLKKKNVMYKYRCNITYPHVKFQN